MDHNQGNILKVPFQNSFFSLFFTGVFLLSFFHCAANTYELPPPNQNENLVLVATEEPQEEPQNEDNYQLVRQVVLQIYEAIQREDWQTVYENISLETRLLFDTFSPYDGAQALASGVFNVDGLIYQFDPATILLPENPTYFSDDPPEGTEEFESLYRKDIFISTNSGEIFHIICIKEGERWLLHSPEIPMDQLLNSPQIE